MPLYPFCFQIFFSHVEEPTILRKKLEETTEQERRCVLPTRVSCHATSLEIAKVLDEFGIDVAAPCNEIGGVAPLLSAAFDGKIDYVNFLLEKKADMNITDNDGCSALHHAVEGNQEDMLRHLIEKGCDKTIKNKVKTDTFRGAIQGSTWRLIYSHWRLEFFSGDFLIFRTRQWREEHQTLKYCSFSRPTSGQHCCTTVCSRSLQTRK
eukprot:m.288642 g.288642  ORF g.288642 m.288642 type:complete len:208 (+) comp40706_c0_seq78:1101-1724(+)